MRDDPYFGERISKKVKKIKEDKQNLMNIADEYGAKYSDEIIAGTEQRAKLLTEGKTKGLNEEQVMATYNKFLPTIYTPLLNFLYFMLRESEDTDRNKYRQRDSINELLVKTNQLYHNEGDRDLTPTELNTLINEKLSQINKETATDKTRQEINKKLLNEEKENSNLQETPDMVTYLYGSVTLDQFNILKKLKALSCSDNIAEATLAFKKGKELSVKYGLEWERIPCYYKKK